MDGEPDTQVLRESADMIGLLQKFQRGRQALKLSLNDSTLLTTTILDGDWSNFKLGIDQPITTSGEAYKDTIERCDLEGVIQNTHYSMYQLHSVERSLTSDNKLWFSFPRQIVYQQRRQSFRTLVPRAIHSRLEIEVDACTVTGRLLDLSAGGVAGEFDGSDFVERLESGTQVKLNLRIDTKVEVQCVATIQEIRRHNQGWRLGLAFKGISPQQQRSIDKAVVDLQRSTRLNQTRS